MREPVVDPLDGLLAAHGRALTAAVGDWSLCAISRSGESWPAAKYHEGALVALRDVRRAAGDRPAAARRLLAEWRRPRARALEMGGDGVAYRAGGVDALGVYLDRVDASDGRP